MTVILSLDSGYFNAGAVFEKAEGGWVCTDAAPIIRWMVGKPPDETRKYINKRGWSYEWLRVQSTI